MVSCRISPGARAFFTSRAGGVSRPPYGGPGGSGGLNLALHVGDDPADVVANRARLERTLGPGLVWMDQVHGNTVRVAVDPAAAEAAGECDALVIGPQVTGRAPAVLVADCAPVLLADESGSVLAAVHVGRAGLFAGVLPAALRRVRELTAEPVHAAVGPHICGRCYEVGAELSERARAFGAASTTTHGTPAIDLLAGIRGQLEGVPLTVIDACTVEDERWFSYRRDGVTGRFAGLAVRNGDTPPAIRRWADALG